MFLRRCERRKNGKRHTYWALVESYRTAQGSRQRVVAYLGELKPTEHNGWAQLGSHLNGDAPARRPQLSLFDPPCSRSTAATHEEPVKVRLNDVRLERIRDFGDVWLAWGLWRMLELDQVLEREIEPGREEIAWGTVAAILTIARFCEPGSERHIEEKWYRRTALEELLGVAPEKVHTDRLYDGLDRLLPHKETLERHLRQRFGELFDRKCDLLLYDITSTYFEGDMLGCPLAQRGYSRDQRPDRPQVCLGLVVSTPKQMLRQFEQHLTEQDWAIAQDGVEVKLVPGPKGDETFLLARSADRRAKELAMHEKFTARIERGLQKLQAAAAMGRLKDEATANQRLGRLKEQNWRAGHAFDVTIRKVSPPRGKQQLEITWQRNARFADWSQLADGCYLLRSNRKGVDAATLWKRYIQLSEAEWAFRITKDELSIRPIWHHKEDRVKAHILVCFLAYAMWKTLAGWMRNAGLGDAPRTLIYELANIKSGDILLPAETHDGTQKTIRLRHVTEPDAAQAVLLLRLGLTLPRRLRRLDEAAPL